MATTAYLVGQYVQHLTARRCSPETIRNRISKVANEFLHENDVPDTLHSLRHRFITEIARRGGIHRAREAAGHTSISATQIYAQVVRSEVRPLVEQVGKLLA
jgi:site-specific recombinase XerD